MAQNFGTELRLTQQQVLAPQLQQSLKLLQVPAVELQAMIEKQLLTNPTLETYDPHNYKDEDNENLKVFDPDEQDKLEHKKQLTQSIDSEVAEIAETFDNESPISAYEKELDSLISEDENWKEYYNSDEITQNINSGYDILDFSERNPDNDELYEYKLNSITEETSLVDELKQQSCLVSESEDEDRIFEFIIGSLDKNGFLTETPESIAKELNLPIELVEKVINKFKKFDPPGIGAANLKESLLIQMERAEKKDSIEYQIVENYFDDLLNNRQKKIAKKFKISLEKLQDIIKEIGKYDPKPGRNLTTEEAPIIKPDVIVTQNEDGSFKVETNDNILPYVRIIPKVKQYLKEKKLSKKELKKLKEDVKNGEFFINNLKYRKRTILAVAEAIVEAQKDFMNYGPKALKPLCMKEIADKVGVHEATVSRTVNDKYMDTPQGIFEMRYFFNSHFENSNGEDISTNIIKEKLKEIIENEDKKKPYSDAKLSELLKKAGYPIARRTVVKYRKELGILNTRQRKQFA